MPGQDTVEFRSNAMFCYNIATNLPEIRMYSNKDDLP